MSIIIAPDSFKGSLSAEEFCRIAKEVLGEAAPHEPLIALPLADGGEGTLDCVLAAIGGTKKEFDTVNALGEPITAPIGFLSDGTAVIEVATVIGLPQLRGREDPLKANTFGLGTLIRKAAESGAERITLTLGGSATNDLGLGMLSAMGYQFYDENGESFIPAGGTMEKIVRFEKTKEFEQYEAIEFSAMCDVENPLLGAEGAAAVFAPQKGASPADVALLEAGASRFAALCGKDPTRPGAGAAGGLGYACLHFLGGTLRRGIDEVLRLYRFEELLKDCRLLISGEGCFDAQSAMGKAVGTLISRADPIPAAVFAGMVKPFDKGLYPNLKVVCPISEGLPLEVALATAKENLRRALRESKLPYPYV
ncbi:MAG: glycerate kinase [Clostridia bacterium]|nr:glycerate kinase [Clostridia bacterium]